MDWNELSENSVSASTLRSFATTVPVSTQLPPPPGKQSQQRLGAVPAKCHEIRLENISGNFRITECSCHVSFLSVVFYFLLLFWFDPSKLQYNQRCFFNDLTARGRLMDEDINIYIKINVCVEYDDDLLVCVRSTSLCP